MVLFQRIICFDIPYWWFILFLCNRKASSFGHFFNLHCLSSVMCMFKLKSTIFMLISSCIHWDSTYRSKASLKPDKGLRMQLLFIRSCARHKIKLQKEWRREEENGKEEHSEEEEEELVCIKETSISPYRAFSQRIKLQSQKIKMWYSLYGP